MFSYYYVDHTPQPDGSHIVHIKGCRALPEKGHRIFLGSLFNAWSAVQTAKIYYPNAKKCTQCLMYETRRLRSTS